jgi:hypothetical protein
MVLELSCAVDTGIPVGQYVRPRTHILPQKSQAVSIYSSSALVKSFARIAVKRAPTAGQR